MSGPGAAMHLVGFVRDPLVATRRLYDAHGPFVELSRLVPGSRKVFVLTAGAAFNRAVLGAPAIWRTVSIAPGGPRNSAIRRLSIGLIRMTGERHAHYRRMLLPPLRRHKVEAMSPTMAGLAAEEIGRWPAGRPIDLWTEVRRLMRSLAIGLLFGGDRAQGYPVADMIGSLLQFNWSVGVAACPVDLPFTPFGRMVRQGEALERRILDWAGGKRGRLDPDDLLSVIVNNPEETGCPVRDPTIVGHVPTLFGAAYETCQNLLVWTLVLLALHPRVAQDLRDELRAALPGDAPPELARLDGLTLLDAVVKESLRILPPVPIQYRVALQDTELLGHPLPRGARVLLSSFLTNRLPALYPEPDRFLPERWAAIDPTPFENPVFSAGPRACPGGPFGLGVVKMALATLLRRHRVTVPPGTRIDYQVRVALSPRGRVPAILRPADEPFTAAPVGGSLGRLVRLPQ
ncbi:MAG: cytochrome P450 [Dongiaceae bacterium]